MLWYLLGLARLIVHPLTVWERTSKSELQQLLLSTTKGGCLNPPTPFLSIITSYFPDNYKHSCPDTNIFRNMAGHK